MGKRWNYSGDLNLKHGGFYWRESGHTDHVYAVKVTPCSDAGGPDNLFHIEAGSIYMPQEPGKVASALSCCGYSLDARGRLLDGCGGVLTGKRKRWMMVDAWNAYHGLDQDAEYVVRIGPAEETLRDGWSPEPDTILRSNAKLSNYVRREHLRG